VSPTAILARRRKPAYAVRLERLRKRKPAATERPADLPRLTPAQKTASEPPLCCTCVAHSQRFLSL